MVRLIAVAPYPPLQDRVAAQMRALGSARLLRTLRPPSGIDLTSNDYLGLAQHPLLLERMIEAVHHEGCGSTGSRLLRGEREAFGRLERAFAVFKQTEAALYFSSGYLANIAVLTTFSETGDVILSDELNHASLIDGIRLSPARRIVFPHRDADALRLRLEENRGTGQAFVVTESLFSMDGDLAPLAEYASLCRSTGALLIVDEAHAVGVYGAGGSGLIEATGIADDVFVSVNTVGKALGVSGAFAAGPSWAIEFLVQRARPFIYSTAAPPALAGAIEASLSIIASEPARRATLRRLSERLRTRLVDLGLPVVPGTSHIIPVLLGDNDRTVRVALRLQAQGFDVRAIRPPTVPPGTARLRISVNVGLTDDVVDRFVAALSGITKDTKITTKITKDTKDTEGTEEKEDTEDTKDTEDTEVKRG